MMQLWFNLDPSINYANVFKSHVKKWEALQLRKLYSLRSQNLTCALSLIMDGCQLEVCIQIQPTLLRNKVYMSWICLCGRVQDPATCDPAPLLALGEMSPLLPTSSCWNNISVVYNRSETECLLTRKQEFAYFCQILSKRHGIHWNTWLQKRKIVQTCHCSFIVLFTNPCLRATYSHVFSWSSYRGSAHTDCRILVMSHISPSQDFTFTSHFQKFCTNPLSGRFAAFVF